MNVLEKLEKRVKELDMTVKLSLASDGYSFSAADQRELLEEAAACIREYQPAFVLQAVRAGKLRHV